MQVIISKLDTMGTTDSRVDAFIEKSADFAKPILNHLRQLIHDTCPEVTETIKWGMPTFEYKGIMCGLASFKKHCAVGFWKEALMEDKYNIFKEKDTAMGSLGRIATMEDLPSDEVIREYIRQAMQLNETGAKAPNRAKKAPENRELTIPAYLTEALTENTDARNTFENFSYTNKKEYVDWLEDAKTDATREKRLAQALEWMAEGKIRNWKYVK